MEGVAMRRALVMIAAFLGAVPLAPAPVHAAATMTPAGPAVPVIVRYDGSGPDAAVRAVAHSRGTVRQRLDLVGALAATVPVEGLAGLRTATGVRAVTPDGPVRLTAMPWLVDAEHTSMASVVRMTGADSVWVRRDTAGRPLTGKGVGVAVIDSGIAPVTGLSGAGKVIHGVDLSFESQAPNLRNLDTFGHGTHMAGIIAGRDPSVTAGTETRALSDSTRFLGMAPDATLVNVKVAATDGSVDVSQVIAAIDWVVAHRDDPGFNIRVLNLSFGTDSAQDPRLDPLSHAVEAAWRKGIVVVVAVGNDGPGRTRVSMPAANPYVIAVGAADHRVTEVTVDDTVAAFSTKGNLTRHADLVAPGRSIVALRTPNSFIDTTYPGGRLPTTLDPTQRAFKGSGTSQATAVVSGAAALLLQQRPTLTPDQVKKLLVTAVDLMPAGDPIARGAGQLNVGRAAALPTPAATVAAQKWAASTGLGTLEGARGSAHVADPVNGVELTGERDIMGTAWAPAAWAPACTRAATWSGGTWNGRTWNGTWTGVAWSGGTWAGRSWSNVVWDGRTWSGRTWSGRTWSGRTWTSDLPAV